MFAVVRTGGKQYRVAPGDKIAVEKLSGDAGETITLGEVLLAGDGGELQDVGKVTVSAEIIAQAKSEKVTVFKKRRRHNYRRKAGHRQQLTLLRILSVGDSKAPAKAPAAEAPKDEPAPVAADQAKDSPVENSPVENRAVESGAVESVAAEKPAAKKPAAKKAAAKSKPKSE